MQKKELTERLAEQNQVPAAAAADELDDAIHAVLKNFRRQESARPNALERLIKEALDIPANKGQGTPS